MSGRLAIDDGLMGAARASDGTLLRPFGTRFPEGRASAPAEAFHDWIVAELSSL